MFDIIFSGVELVQSVWIIHNHLKNAEIKIREKETVSGSLVFISPECKLCVCFVMYNKDCRAWIIPVNQTNEQQKNWIKQWLKKSDAYASTRARISRFNKSLINRKKGAELKKIIASKINSFRASHSQNVKFFFLYAVQKVHVNASESVVQVTYTQLVPVQLESPTSSSQKH